MGASASGVVDVPRVGASPASFSLAQLTSKSLESMLKTLQDLGASTMFVDTFRTRFLTCDSVMAFLSTRNCSVTAGREARVAIFEDTNFTTSSDTVLDRAEEAVENENIAEPTVVFLCDARALNFSGELALGFRSESLIASRQRDIQKHMGRSNTEALRMHIAPKVALDRRGQALKLREYLFKLTSKSASV